MIGGDGSRSVPDPPLVNISTLPDGSRLVHPSFLFFSFLQEARHRLYACTVIEETYFSFSRNGAAIFESRARRSPSLGILIILRILPQGLSFSLSLSIRVLKLLVAGQWYARSSTQFQKLRKITVNRLVCPSLHWAIR